MLLVEKYDWIPEERQYFGRANSPYDFNVHDPKEAEKRINKLTENKDKLAKSVNMRAMNTLGSAEDQVWKLHCFFSIGVPTDSWNPAKVCEK